jgi:hypothetical protein
LIPHFVTRSAFLASELAAGVTLAAITIPEAPAKLGGFAPQVGF